MPASAQPSRINDRAATPCPGRPGRVDGVPAWRWLPAVLLFPTLAGSLAAATQPDQSWLGRFDPLKGYVAYGSTVTPITADGGKPGVRWLIDKARDPWSAGLLLANQRTMPKGTYTCSMSFRSPTAGARVQVAMGPASDINKAWLEQWLEPNPTWRRWQFRLTVAGELPTRELLVKIHVGGQAQTVEAKEIAWMAGEPSGQSDGQGTIVPLATRTIAETNAETDADAPGQPPPQAMVRVDRGPLPELVTSWSTVKPYLEGVTGVTAQQTPWHDQEQAWRLTAADQATNLGRVVINLSPLKPLAANRQYLLTVPMRQLAGEPERQCTVEWFDGASWRSLVHQDLVLSNHWQIHQLVFTSIRNLPASTVVQLNPKIGSGQSIEIGPVSLRRVLKIPAGVAIVPFVGGK